MNGCARVAGFDPQGCEQTLNRWIVGETARAGRAVDAALEAYRFNDAASAVYQFVWGSFCDWYLEFSKPALLGDDGPRKREFQATAAWVLDQILLLLHPIAPFVTEELWGLLDGDRDSLLIEAPWPVYPEDAVDAAADAEISWLIGLISALRSTRSELNVPPSARLPLFHHDADAVTVARLAAHGESLAVLARIDGIAALDGQAPKGSAQLVVGEATYVLPLEGVIDVGQEAARLARHLDKLDGEIAKIETKLGNEKFTSRAPAQVIEEQRQRRAAAIETRDKLAAAMKRLAAL
jgi:valyl-tRNA synthetase